MSARSHRWLSRGAEQLEVLLQAQRGQEFDCDVLVVGSGYGGAVAAARLAGTVVDDPGRGPRPAVVWLVERGAEIHPGQFPSRFSELAGHVRFGLQDGQPARGRDEGLFDVRVGPDVALLLGNGLGGGSLINAGVMELPTAEQFGRLAWPRDITYETLQPFYEMALEMLGAKKMQMPADRVPRKLAVLDEMAARQQPTGPSLPKAHRCQVSINLTQSVRGTQAGVKLDPCTMCGDCLTGCNQGAKGSLDTNYLALARQRGAEIFCGVTVRHVALREKADDSSWSLAWHFTDRQLRSTQASNEGPAIRARHVVLAAGSLGSTEILLRSRGALDLPAYALGSRFSINGDLIAAGIAHRQPVGIVADQESDPARMGERRIGPTICGLVRVPAAAEGPAFAVEEFAVPAALRQVLGEVTAQRLLFGSALATDPALPPTADPRAVDDDRIERTSLFGCMGDDGAFGRIVLPTEDALACAEGGARVQWSREDKAQAKAIFDHARRWLSRTKLPAAVLSSHSLLGGELPWPAVHPLGGCRMADDRSQGVVDADGLVFRAHGLRTYETLAVLDGSIVPGALGINPALTISALAERALPRLKARWGLTDAKGALPLAVPDRPKRPRMELPPAEVNWTVRERQHGPIQIGSTDYWARLELEFDPVPGFRKALQLTRRVLRIRRAELRLQPARLGDDEFTLEDIEPGSAGEPQVAAMLAGTVELFANGPDDPRQPPVVLITYRLGVQSLGPQAPPGLRVGSRLEAVKSIRLAGNGEGPASLWREFSEMEVTLDRGRSWRWALDLADLARRRDPLLSLQAATTMPDALSDLAAPLLYVLRMALPRLMDADGESTDPALLALRRPGRFAADGPEPVEYRDPESPAAGWRLTRYGGNEGRQPIVLIHGLGASGANYTLAAIRNNLARHLHDNGRDVWVLDLRSSIANECWRTSKEAATATVDDVAARDIGPAIRFVHQRTSRPVDVFAHCMGAVMFTLAALGDEKGLLRPSVRAVVLSQVGPLVRMSPMNQLRGFVGSYLQTFFSVGEFDATPDARIDDNGVANAVKLGSMARLFDVLLGTFPYPDDDALAAADPALEGTKYRTIRRRIDAIYGQLFELRNMAPETLGHLAALFGWVKVQMLTQAIHFARQEMLTDARGRNATLSRENVLSRFDFPLLIVHGRRNRVFDWRGSLASWQTLRSLLRPDASSSWSDEAHRCLRFGTGTPLQLAVFEEYGHLDCILGRQAHEHVFPVATRFLDEFGDVAGTSTARPMRRAPVFVPETPWLGPVLGRLVASARTLQLTVLLQPTRRRTTTDRVVVVPMRAGPHGLEPDLDLARWIGWRSVDGVAIEGVIRLNVSLDGLDGLDSFALLTLHSDLADARLPPVPPIEGDGRGREDLLTVITPGLPPLAGLAASEGLAEAMVDPASSADAGERVPTGSSPENWLEGGLPVTGATRDGLTSWLREQGRERRLERLLLHLTPRVQAAADQGRAASRTAPLTFALVSCQYPPGLLDREPAQASLRRLLRDAEADDGPQFMLMAGDQVYLDATAGVFDASAAGADGPGQRAARLDRLYELNWGMPAFRRLTSRLPVYPILDDHEVGDNWQGLDGPPPGQGSREPADVQAALEAYERFQGALTGTVRNLRESRSYQVHPAGMPLFVLDTRTQRSVRTASSIDAATILPPKELQGLLDRLKAAPRNLVKFVLTPVPILPPERFPTGGGPLAQAERLRSDTWSGFPASTRALLRGIFEADIRRVVFLSGDSHLSSVTSFTLGGSTAGHAVVSIVSSGLYAPWPFANQRPDELQLQGLVDIGTPADGLAGTMQLHAMSSADGYAIVRVEPHKADEADDLHVSLRAATGGEVRCTVELR